MKPSQRKPVWFVVALLGLAFGAPAHAGPKQKPPAHRRDIAALFALTGPVPSLSFTCAPAELAKLRTDPRNYAECTMTEAGGASYRGVRVKLKGGRSFRKIDDKPGLTVSLKKAPGKPRFHGLEKFHLNNSVQDSTYLHETLAGEMARHAGVPAGRCTHAFVAIEGRDRGLYVLREAFDEDFLAEFFDDPTGDLYDGGRFEELAPTMEKDQGDDDSRDNIRALIAASTEPDPARRWQRLEAILDVDAYVSFVAFEALIAQRDGYHYNHNNYRVYFDPKGGKAHFVHHGMDQTFATRDLSLLRGSPALVSSAVFSNPIWYDRYLPRVRALLASTGRAVDWDKRLAALGSKLARAISKKDPALAAAMPANVALAQKHLRERLQFVAEQLENLPKPVALDPGGTLLLSPPWRANNQSGSAMVVDEVALDGKDRLHLHANRMGWGMWEKNVHLPRGRYRFEARVKTAGIVPGSDGKPSGARLAARAGPVGSPPLTGDNAWQTTGFEFETPGAEVVMRLELRAERGEVWLDRESARVIRIATPRPRFSVDDAQPSTKTEKRP